MRNGLTPAAAGAIDRAGAARDGELRSTFVDAEEAAMRRAMQRLNGDDQAWKVGNNYSQQNRERTQARLNAMKAEGIVPMKPRDEETMRKKQEASAKAPRTISERAIRVPRVGVMAPQRRPLVDCLPKRRGEVEIRANEGNFARPAAPRGAIVRSSDSRKCCMLIAPALGTLPKFGVCASSRARLAALGGSISGESAEWLGAQRLTPPSGTASGARARLPRPLQPVPCPCSLCLAPPACALPLQEG